MRTKSKSNKNGYQKKAKRRVKDAQKIIQECFTGEEEYSMVSSVASQIALLCQRLVQISENVKLSDKELVRTTDGQVKDLNTDSDTEDASSDSRGTTPQHIYSEIVTPVKEDACLSARKENNEQSSESSQNTAYANVLSSPELNVVKIFSDDSDSPQDLYKNTIDRRSRSRSPRKQADRYFRTESKINKSMFDDRQTRAVKLLRDPDLVNPNNRQRQRSLSQPSLQTEVPFAQQLLPFGDDQMIEKMFKASTGADSFRNFYSNVDSRNPTASQTIVRADLKSNPQVACGSPFVITDTRVKIQNNTVEHNVPKPNENVQKILPPDIRKWSNLSPSSSRSSQKRLLPSVPKSPEASTETKLKIQNGPNKIASIITVANRYQDKEAETIEDKFASEEQNSQTEKSANTNTFNVKQDDFDDDEIEFRENVRNAREEIMHQLKLLAPEKLHTEYVPSYKDFETKIDARSSPCWVSSPDTKPPMPLPSMRCIDKPQNRPPKSNTKNPNVKKMSDEDNRCKGGKKSPQSMRSCSFQHSSFSESDSIVASNIKKFETGITNNNERLDMRSRRSSLISTDTFGRRFRSSSEPRMQSETMNSLTRKCQPKQAEATTFIAMQPCSCQNNYHPCFAHNCNQSSKAVRMTLPINLKKTSTENDLHQLVKSESPSSIRQWSLRRSASFTSKRKQQGERQKPLQSPKYCYAFTLSLPENMKRCHVSAMTVLKDESLVLLDERNFYLHLFDQAYKHVHERKLFDIPRGCEYVNGNNIIVALPYKRALHRYLVQRSAISLEKEFSLKCNAWILDITFIHGCLHILCKGGHIHRMTKDGIETSQINIGMGGRLFGHPRRKRLYILGEGRLTKFDLEGNFISSHSDIDAYSVLFLENQTYVADRQKHRILPLSDVIDAKELTADKIDYPSAICSSISNDKLFVSQYEESLNDVITRTVKVYTLNKTLNHCNNC